MRQDIGMCCSRLIWLKRNIILNRFHTATTSPRTVQPWSPLWDVRPRRRTRAQLGSPAVREPHSRRDSERYPSDTTQADGQTNQKRQSVQLCHGDECQEQRDDACSIAGCDA